MIKAFRTRAKLSQAALAKHLGVSANTVARWERGVLGMRPKQITKLARLMASTDLSAPLPPAKANKANKGEK